MTIVQKIENWGTAHHPAWLDYLRIILGGLLFMKGVNFIGDTSQLQTLIGGTKMEVMPIVAIHLVAFAHLIGGLLIAFGLLTRFACVVQIPILFVAVFLVNIRQGFSFMNSELWFSLLILALLITFWVVGSGKFSADDWMNSHKMT